VVRDYIPQHVGHPMPSASPPSAEPSESKREAKRKRTKERKQEKTRGLRVRTLHLRLLVYAHVVLFFLSNSLQALYLANNEAAHPKACPVVVLFHHVVLSLSLWGELKVPLLQYQMRVSWFGYLRHFRYAGPEDLQEKT